MDSLLRWLGEHGKETLESTGLVFSLCLAAASFRADARERRIANLMSLADSHRELWMQITEKPELTRILKRDIDVEQNPVSVIEERFVHLLITHLAVTFEAMKNKDLPGLAGVEADIRDFFSLPIPAQVWIWSQRFQQPDFVRFVDDAVRREGPPSQ